MSSKTMHRERGFTLLELMVATGIFLVLCAAMFGLLQLSQQKYTNETQVSGAFHETRLAIDQIVRDFNVSGFPPLSLFSNVPTNSSKYAVSPVAWDPGYTAGATCQLGTGNGGTCQTPSDFDLILETDTGNGVSWIRYQLIGTTLYRSVVPKIAGDDPVTDTNQPNVLVPFVTNVMNNPTAPATQVTISQITANYPTMFPGGAAQPIFQYTCDTPTGPQPCPTAGSSGVPSNIRDVVVTLIVMTQQPNQQNQMLELVELTGRGHRANPWN
jgi:prepilin-type N-terminal cleavage/methylation domain-containing protein